MEVFHIPDGSQVTTVLLFKGDGTVTCSFTAKKLATSTDWNKLNNLDFISSKYIPIIETEVVQIIDIPGNSNNYGAIKWE